MGASQNLSSLTCELRILRAKNIESVPAGNLFVRYYFLTEKNRRIRFTSREIPSTCDPCWNESITLECLGANDAMDKLRTQSVVFELRLRKTSSILGRIGGSKLLFRAEVGWKDVLNSTESSLQKWVTSPTACRFVPEGLKSPALQISMKVQDPRMLIMPKMNHVRRRRPEEWKECGCGHGTGCNGRDDDIFALAALVEVF